VTSFLLQESCDIDAAIGDGRSSLHMGVERGHFRIVERLIGYGCKLDLADKNGDTPLHYAVKRDSNVSGLTDETPQMKKVKDIS